MPRPSSRAGRLWHAFAGASGELAAEIDRFKPDCIYTRGVHPYPAWDAALASQLPLVVEINGYAEEEAPWFLRGRLGRAHRRYFGRAAAVTTVSGKLRRDMIERYGLPAPRVFDVCNGADLDRFRPLDRADCRRRLGWAADGHVLLFVGSFYAHHAMDVLAEACAAVTESRPATRAVLVGDGPERPAVQEIVRRRGLADRILLPGAMAPEQVPLAIGAADVCLLTLRSIRTPERGCSPIKLYEYMAMARPVAVLVDSREVVEDVRRAGAGPARLATGRRGEDAAALAADIVALLDDPPRAEACGKAGRRAAERFFNWHRAGGRVATILEAARGRAPWPACEEGREALPAVADVT